MQGQRSTSICDVWMTSEHKTDAQDTRQTQDRHKTNTRQTKDRHKMQDKHKTKTRQTPDKVKTDTRHKTQDRDKTGPHQVKASQAAHEALDVVNSPKDGLPPPWLLLDLGLNAGFHAVQHTRHCCKDAGLQGCHIISHLLHITLQRQGHNGQARRRNGARQAGGAFD